ncbi:MAG: hypothetical protein JXB50_13600 [Spirochaetes bacterium]|nr:hypothetical protein [Spirochaetota bacterium]
MYSHNPVFVLFIIEAGLLSVMDFQIRMFLNAFIEFNYLFYRLIIEAAVIIDPFITIIALNLSLKVI